MLPTITRTETHDVRDMKGRKWSWVQVFWLTYKGREYVHLVLNSASAQTGWDFPTECDTVRGSHG
jgi:hypothetical protein